MGDEIRPFTISIPDADLSDLHQRLRRTRFPTELEDAGNDHGAPLADIRRLVTYWAEEYDWRKAEAELNALPHFTTTLQASGGFEALDVHFVHMRSKRADAIPLLFAHGWPGSFLEATKLLNPLTAPPDDSTPAFHVVAPSLPGYGFSEASKKRGFGADEIGEMFHQLMLRLGYDEYATQGGDWGFMITRAMGRRYAPEHVKAQHVNLNHFPQPSFWRNPGTFFRTMLAALVTGFSEREKRGFARSRWFKDEGMGYFAMQSTRPQTIGYALADSPTALLAWIYEKLVDWTDSYPWTPDELCTWISIYWFSTAGPRAAVQLYYEFTHASPSPSSSTHAQTQSKGNYGIGKDGGGSANDARSKELTEFQDVKLALAHFPRDVLLLPGYWGHGLGNLVYEKYHDKGGHFAAWECPEAIVDDLRTMFGPNGGARGVIKTKGS
ncbi:microsomal epoxide hydrolase [Nemania sp. FL0916]|nr:microsomal epoxide hydrolase [Nemania sp. FL0916]